MTTTTHSHMHWTNKGGHVSQAMAWQRHNHRCAQSRHPQWPARRRDAVLRPQPADQRKSTATPGAEPLEH